MKHSVVKGEETVDGDKKDTGNQDGSEIENYEEHKTSKDSDDSTSNEVIPEYSLNLLSDKPIGGRDTKLEVTSEQEVKGCVVEVMNSDIESTETENHSKVDHVNLGNVDSLDQRDFINKEEADVRLNGGDMGTVSCEEIDDKTLDMLDVNAIEIEVDLSTKVGCDGSDSGVEVNGFSSHGGSESSPALLRALSNNIGGYLSSYGGLEDSLTFSTGTPAASCDSSLISCYSTYEETEDIVSSATTTLLQIDGDGTSEGGSESSSVTSKDTRSSCRNGLGKKLMSGVNRLTAKKRTLVDVANLGVSPPTGRGKSPSPTGTPGNTSRTKPTILSTPGTNKAPTGAGAVAAVKSSNIFASTHRRERTPTATSSNMARSGSHRSTSCSSTKSSNSSMSKSACSSAVGVSKGRCKDMSLSCGSESRKDITGTSHGVAKGRGSRSNSTVRTKIIGGTDDGRWPSSTNKSHSFASKSRGCGGVDGQSRKQTVMSSSTLVGGVLMESKASALEKYATLPRRRRCKSPEVIQTIDTTVLRSHSVSRDPSLNRAASLRKQHHQRDGSNQNKSLPPYPRRKYGKIIIYHETSCQTTLTANDVDKALAGVAVKEIGSLDAIETQEQEVQVDQRIEEIENLELKLRVLSEDHNRLKADSERLADELAGKEQLLEETKAEKHAIREELDSHTQRVIAMLRNAKGDHLEEGDTVDCLQALETYLETSSHVVIKQQKEINELQTLCRTLKKDLEKSLAAQKILLQQQQETEAESIELQEFLQAEKSTLGESLKDSESEINVLKRQILQKESELEQQQEECKHLVRISEQRRQENLAFQAQLSNLEQRSRELLLQQGAAVSGAAVALSGLSSRLDGLVEQLVVSYNISEKDLEDVIFHNEAYSKSNSSVEVSPERKRNDQSSADAENMQLSPKRGASFVTAVISAIKNAAGKRSNLQRDEFVKPNQDLTEGMLERVEPEEETTTEQDAEDTRKSRYSVGSVSSCLATSESLQNLSQAILNRQQFEIAQIGGSCSNDDLAGIDYENSTVAMLPHLEDCSPAITLVDQIIDVDNLVTKLLKVLRIIQLENDTCVDELHDERLQLAEQVRREQESRREVQDELRNWERVGARLRGEAQDVRLQLQKRVQELERTRDELQRNRELTEQLTSELHNLSSLCKQTEQQLHVHEEEAENILQQWQESGHFPSPEILSRIIAARDEIPFLREKLEEKEHQLNEMGQKYSLSKQVLTENWHQAATEVRRQYEAIDNALETLHSVQGVVIQCPPLVKLQQDLEETNFQCASSLPLIAADPNANAPSLVTLNGTHNGGNNGLETTHKSGNTINGTT